MASPGFPTEQDSTGPEFDGESRYASDWHRGKYVGAGVLMILAGLLVFGWCGYALVEDYSAHLPEFLQALYDPRVVLPPVLFDAEQWGLAAALLLAGGIACAGRRFARGAGLALAAVLLLVAARELYGLLNSEQFRSQYVGGTDLGPAIYGSWGLAAVCGLLVLILLGRSGEVTPGGRRLAPDSPAYPVAGVLSWLLAGASIAWLVRNRLTGEHADVGGYFKGLLDPARNTFFLAGKGDFLEAVFIVAYLLLGALAFARRPAARGGIAILAVVDLYVGLRQMLGLTLSDGSLQGAKAFEQGPFPNWKVYTESGLEGWLWIATLAGTALVAFLLWVMLLRTPEGDYDIDDTGGYGEDFGTEPWQPAGAPPHFDSRDSWGSSGPGGPPGRPGPPGPTAPPPPPPGGGGYRPPPPPMPPRGY